ncbi:hypothetical protein EYF80_011208 [Liparis tanakae]|uniref:Uncharacterized protein n=1 Tax=Liparis tanakae TaxID=230148 RepID=A0A4Z2IN74_9TELE|nr:hypothetical protein EYF80_011208 [Liparis tanakae]
MLLGGRRGPLFQPLGPCPHTTPKLAQLSPLHYALIRTLIALRGGRDRPIPAPPQTAPDCFWVQNSYPRDSGAN